MSNIPDTKIIFHKLLKHPERQFLTEAKALLDKYPFVTMLQMVYAKLMYDTGDCRKEKILNHASVYCSERKKFFRFIHNIPEESVVQAVVPEFNLILQEKVEVKEEIIGDDLISKYLNSKPVFALKRELTEELDEEESELEVISEAMADVYIRKGKIDKAKRIYEKLSLKYPEKSSYFAARIEKLKKELNNNN